MVLYIRTAIIAPSQHKNIESASAKIGLFIYVGKTKVMTLNLGDQVGNL